MKYLIAFILLISFELSAQKYFTEKYEPFNSEIESPESFLGYPIGSEHTRHDNIVSYFKNIAEKSDRAILTFYGKTHEGRKLPMLIVSSPENLTRTLSGISNGITPRVAAKATIPDPAGKLIPIGNLVWLSPPVPTVSGISILFSHE